MFFFKQIFFFSYLMDSPFDVPLEYNSTLFNSSVNDFIQQNGENSDDLTQKLVVQNLLQAAKVKFFFKKKGKTHIFYYY